MSRSRSHATNSAARIYGWSSFGVIAVAAVLLERAFPGMGWLMAWLIPSNVVTFCVFCMDKMLARSQRMRVPEAVLHTLALTGGVAGALLGMAVARHKTSKRSFRVTLGVLLLLEAVLLGLWLFGGLAGLGLESPWAGSQTAQALAPSSWPSASMAASR